MINFLKAKTLWTSVKEVFKSVIWMQCNGSCCVHMTSGASIYLYVFVSLLVFVNSVCIFLSV